MAAKSTQHFTHLTKMCHKWEPKPISPKLWLKTIKKIHLLGVQLIQDPFSDHSEHWENTWPFYSHRESHSYHDKHSYFCLMLRWKECLIKKYQVNNTTPLDTPFNRDESLRDMIRRKWKSTFLCSITDSSHNGLLMQKGYVVLFIVDGSLFIVIHY